MTALTPGEAGTPECDELDSSHEIATPEKRASEWEDLARRLERERDALRGAAHKSTGSVWAALLQEMKAKYPGLSDLEIAEREIDRLADDANGLPAPLLFYGLTVLRALRSALEFIEQEAGFDCDNADTRNPEPCEACGSCRARASLKAKEQGQ